MDDFSSVVAATNSNLSRLSKTVLTTATTLASPYGEITAPAYRQTVQAVTAPMFRKRMFSNRAPSHVVKTSLGAAIALKDEQLRALPESSSRFSLFQGFVATQEAETLDNCEVKKELASCEIKELDARMAELKAMRTIVFERVAQLEKDERRLEAGTRAIEAPSGPDSDGVAVVDGTEASGADGSNRAGAADESGAGAYGLDKPGELGTAMSASEKDRRQSLRKHKARRRTQPTLQRFYSPGDTIRTIATGDPVVALDFDLPFGTLVAATGPSVQIWDLSNGDLAGTLDGHSASVKCLQLDDTLLATGGADARVKLWDVPSRRELADLDAHLKEITALHFDDVSLVSGSSDRTIRQWDLMAGKCIQTLDVMGAGAIHSGWAGQSAPVGALQNFDAALASGTADGVVRLWDLRTGNVQRSLPGHTAPITCLHFDDVHLVSGSADASVRVWDLRTGAILDAYRYDNPVTSLAFDATKIVAAAGDVMVYDRQKQEHWQVGQDVVSVRLQKGYLVGGGEGVGVWAC